MQSGDAGSPVIHGKSLRTRDLGIFLVLMLGTLAAYYQVLGFDFVNFDDPVYVTQNWDVQGGWFRFQDGLPVINLDTFLWAFTETTKSGHWHPLTWLSLALDYQIFGLRPWGFHLTNLLLHCANTWLLFLVLRRSTGANWPSAAVAGFFAWHPLHVESVAWITERKDVLSTFFWMLTMLAYLGYVHKPAWRSYAWVVLFFTLGLLSKPMVVTLPFVLLLWDFWPLGRFGPREGEAPAEPGPAKAWESSQDARQEPRPPVGWRWAVLEKIPLLVLAAVSSMWTFLVMQPSTQRRLEGVLTLENRFCNGLLAYVAYLRKMVWPMDLAAYYPVVLSEPPILEASLAALFLAGITLAALLATRSRPYLLVGWLWYLGTLLPVSLRLQAGAYALADRYTYIPLIGLFLAGVWALRRKDETVRWRLASARLLAVLLAICLVLTWFQVKIWADSETLWRHTLALTSNNFLAHVNLAEELDRQDRGQEALGHYEEAVRIYPQLPLGYKKLGMAYEKLQMLEKSRVAFEKLVQLAPSDRFARQRLAGILNQLGREEEAAHQDQELERLYRQSKENHD